MREFHARGGLGWSPEGGHSRSPVAQRHLGWHLCGMLGPIHCASCIKYIYASPRLPTNCRQFARGRVKTCTTTSKTPSAAISVGTRHHQTLLARRYCRNITANMATSPSTDTIAASGPARIRSSTGYWARSAFKSPRLASVASSRDTSPAKITAPNRQAASRT